MRRRHLPLLCALPLQAAAALRIGSWNRQVDHATRAGEFLLAAAYAELGLSIEFVDRPMRRALSELLSGELDANLMRVPEMLSGYEKQLILIQPALFETLVFSYGGGPPPQRWEDLARRRVGVLRGIRLLEQKLPEQARRIEASTPTELSRLLAEGVVELVLSVELELAPPLLRSPARQRCAIAAVGLHHVLRRDQAVLAARLGALLAAWHASGRVKALLREAFR